MKSTFLEEILESTRETVRERRKARPLNELRMAAVGSCKNGENHRLKKALSNKERTNVIAEIKRASPSKGIINDQIDVAETAMNYQLGGACAISVLTEEKYFRGTLDDLRAARQAVELPILRKDFTVDEYQIYEASEAGADAILLIVAALPKQQISEFLIIAEKELGIDALVEVHTEEDLETAIEIGAPMIGINNRNLRTFEVSLDVSRSLIEKSPPESLIVSESGITTRDEISNLKSLGFDGFLIGETLMKSSNASTLIGGMV